MNNKLLVKIYSIFILSIVLGSCKQPDPPKSIVTVTDEDGVALRDALVILDCTPAKDAPNTQICKEGIKKEGNTDKNGQIEFTTKLPAVLKAQAKYARINGFTTDSLRGDAFVEFKEGEVTEQTIIVYP